MLYDLAEIDVSGVEGLAGLRSDGGPVVIAISLAGEPRSEDVELTERENDLLTLIAEGRSNQEIAEALVLSANSVKSYIRTAYKKIGPTD